jgi:MFS family permease
VSAVCIASTNFSAMGKRRPRTNVLGDIRFGLAYIARTRIQRDLLTIGTLATLAWGPTAVLIPLLADRELHAGAEGLGILLSAGAAGGVIGPIIAGQLGARFGAGREIIFGVGAMGALSAALGIAPTLSVAAAIYFLRSAANSIINVPLVALVQSTTPEELRGRVLNTVFTSAEFARPLSLGPAVTLSEQIGVPSVFAAQGALLILIALYGTVSSIRQAIVSEA